MENVAPARALARRSYQLLQLGFVVAAIGIFLSLIALLGFAIPPIPPGHAQFGLYDFGRKALLIVGMAVGILGLALAIRAVTRRRENDLALITGDFLSSSLDERFSFIRNINRPGLGYIDAVLVGPPGALVFRILDRQGNLANEAAEWLKMTGSNQWTPLGFSPTREAVEDVEHLRAYLAKRGFADVPVYGVIVFTGDETVVQIAQQSPVVPISHLNTLVENLRGSYLANENRIPQQLAVAIRHLLMDEA
ncbi:MAG: NERD domain-containing protein [Chloroflexi bacterium]|nr:NERD domain-containing protein [Chloroflexota bacterium]